METIGRHLGLAAARVDHVPVRSMPVGRNVLPAICDVAVTNVCNAAGELSSFPRARDAAVTHYVDPTEFTRALPILLRHRIRYVTFQGGEPLLHPDIRALVGQASRAGIQCGLITNGWLLPPRIHSLAAAGLKRLLILIDSHEVASHERNRGLPGLGSRIAESIARARTIGIPVWACVTVSRLVDFDALPARALCRRI